MRAAKKNRARVYDWEEFASRYRSPKGQGRQEEVTRFLNMLKNPKEVAVYDVPDGLTLASARTMLYTTAKQLGKNIGVTARDLPPNTLLVAVVPKDDEDDGGVGVAA